MALFAISGANVVLARDLTPADDGTVAYTVTATENGVSVSAVGMLSITQAVVPQTPVAVVLATPSFMLPDNAKAGTAVTVVTITTSDSMPFAGTVTVDGPA